MMEQLGFHTVEELEALSLEQLQALWELVPTDRQKSYRAAYDREVRNAGAIGSDDLESRVAAELLLRYRESALVPVGSRWAKTPQRVQDAAKENDLPQSEVVQSTTTKPSPQMMAILGVSLIVIAGFFLFRPKASDESAPEVTEIAMLTPTAEISPTPTPLALEAQDDVITGGDTERAVAYPVNLQVTIADGTAPRVWVVQRREVAAAEWKYDPNPDIASFINGMSVRPIIGVPWSEDNAAIFASLDAGAVFHLTMNTGAILRFEFADKSEVLRSDTRIFRQVGPGLVLLLIGEVDADGLPTATRTLVTASYPAEQELGRLDALLALAPQMTPQPSATEAPTEPPDPYAALDVQLIRATTQPGQLTTRLSIYNGGTTAVTLTPESIWLALGYVENPPGPRIPADGLQPLTLHPEQVADITLIWAWNSEPYAAFEVGSWRSIITLMHT